MSDTPDTDPTPEVLSDAHVRGLADVAERECTAEQVEAARQEFRAWSQAHGAGDPMDALARMLALEPVSTVKRRGLLCLAALHVRDEGRQDRADVPTQDNPAGDPGEKRKGRRAKKPRATKSKRSTAWVKRLGSTVALYRAEFGVDDGRLLDILHRGGFARRAEEITTQPCYGFAPIDDPASTTSELASLPRIGSDPEFVVWALRKDHKAGCPTHRFRFEAEREATEEARAKGHPNASGPRIKELVEARVTAWYRTATPQTTIFPVVYHRPTFTFAIHAKDPLVVQAAVGRIREVIGGLDVVPGPFDAGDIRDAADALKRTALRDPDGNASGSADLGADLLLWLVGRGLGGTNALKTEETTIEWWLDDAVDLERDTADAKKLRVKLGGAPAEGGSLAAALADGAALRTARLSLRVDELTWSVTLGGGGPQRWALPTSTKPDGTPEGLDAAVDERLRLWQRGQQHLDRLVAAFVAERLDRGAWGQRVHALQRTVLHGVTAARESFISSVGQLALFAEQIEEFHAKNAEAPPKSRGRKARDAAAQAEAK